MNNNNWGSQPNRPPFNNGLPQMPPLQQGFQQQQYGNGNANAMAYMGNQQFQTNSQLIPQQSNHQMPQMQPMPHYGQHQPQLQQQTQQHPAQNFHTHQHQQQQQHYGNGVYGHHATAAPPAQYMSQQKYSQPQAHQVYSQHAPMPSPRQMQQPMPSQRLQTMAQSHQPPPRQQQQQQQQQQQSAPNPLPQQPRPLPPAIQQSRPPPPPSIQQSRPHIPASQPQHQSLQSIDPNQLRQSHPQVPSPQMQRMPHSIDPRQIQQAQSSVPSPQIQQRGSVSINPSQIHQSHSPIPSPQIQQRGSVSTNQSQIHQSHSPIPAPQIQQRGSISINPNQIHQSHSPVPSPQIQQRGSVPVKQPRIHQSQSPIPSPQIQHHAPTTINPSQIHHNQSPAPSPQLQHHASQSIDPSRLQHAQSPVHSPRPPNHVSTSINPSQIQQKQTYVPSPQPQHRVTSSIDPSQLQQKPVPVAASQSPHPEPDAIDPRQLQQSQFHVSPAQLQRPPSDAIDPSKLHQGLPHEGIDPTQLMLSTNAPARKSIPSASSTKMSPVISYAQSPSQHFDTPAVLTCVANDCFRTAHAAVQDVATSLDQRGMDEYYKLIATGLGCLEAALALNKLPPRSEANVRLRYATVLCEETDNLTEAEVALTKGIAVCDKNRLTDLKYCMQFQLVKVLLRRNRKAALVALDKNISEATTYKAVDWVYAFRFLRASFHLQSGNPADTHAMENLRHITSLATHRGDYAIAVLTSLLEGIVHLKSRKEDSIVRVQTCIAQAARYQLDPSVQIPQIEVLTLLLDLACSLQQKTPGVAMQKLKALQSRMDELVKASDWDALRDELLLPLKRQPNSSTTVTGDTNTIIRLGGEHNFIVMSFVTKVHAFVLAYVLSGLALLYHGSKNEKLMEYWTEALNMLAKKNDLVRPAAHSLPMAIEQAKWRAEVECYIHTLIALISATRTQWARVYDCIQKIEALRPKPEDGRLGLLVLYVTGVYHQGTGDLDSAYRIFSDPRFDISDPNNLTSGSAPSTPSEVSLLAALNRIWILQEPSRRDVEESTELLDRVEPYCANHPDIDIRTAYNLAAAAIETNPPRSIQTVKRHISTGLKFAQGANNTQLLGVALNLMRSCLFEGVVGDQAVKSAKAGRAQAHKAGNLLWMSVGEGMLAQTEEMQGQHEEAERLRVSGTVHANEAFVKPGGV